MHRQTNRETEYSHLQRKTAIKIFFLVRNIQKIVDETKTDFVHGQTSSQTDRHTDRQQDKEGYGQIDRQGPTGYLAQVQ